MNSTHQSSSLCDKKPGNQSRSHCYLIWILQASSLTWSTILPLGEGDQRKTHPTSSLWRCLHRIRKHHQCCCQLVDWSLWTLGIHDGIGWPWSSRNRTAHPGNFVDNLGIGRHHFLLAVSHYMHGILRRKQLRFCYKVLGSILDNSCAKNINVEKSFK